MGVAKGALKFLLELKKSSNKVHGKILQLGRQCTYVTANQIKQIAKEFDVAIDESVVPALSFHSGLKLLGFVDDITFFRMIGFEEVESLDYSDYEGSTHVHDLNLPIPEKFYGQYDVILDGGTLEHIFHFPNCLSNIHKMLKPNGIIIHSSPSHNHVDHGFYMFSPTVFYDYYTANKYKILQSNIFEYQSSHTKPWIVYNYYRGCIDHLNYGGWGNKLLGIWFVGEKMCESTCSVIPQQSQYLDSWDLSSSTARVRNLKNRTKDFIKQHPLLYRFAKFIERRSLITFLKRKKPVVVARY